VGFLTLKSSSIMAKKTNSFSHPKATEKLDQLAQSGTSATELIYDLLRIFANFGDGQVRRTKEGPGNAIHDDKTVLVKNLVAYRPFLDGRYDYNAFCDELDAMHTDAAITRHNPRLYIVSNGNELVVYDPKKNDYWDNTLEKLWRDFEFLLPLAGVEPIEVTEEAEADVKSAELMAKLFDDIRRYNNISDPDTVHSLNIFMSRLLFCFFAEDTGLFEGQNLFTNTLKTHTNPDGSDLSEFIGNAFLAMSTNDEDILDKLPDLYSVFPYVNGGLFKEQYPIPVLSRRARTLILNCGEYDWRNINPDIFGSMIQAVVSPEQRAGLGMHYTSVTNIDKVIRPLFFDELMEEYTAACDEAKEKVAKYQADLRRGKTRKNGLEDSVKRLNLLLERISKIKIFDPACGSGNFLIIAFKRLRQLEILIWKAIRDIANIPILPLPNINLQNFYGIEIDEYACDTATLSLWLAEHQMNVLFKDAFGTQPATLPLKPSGKIVCGNACRLDWEKVCPHTEDEEVYVMGNPPYLGSAWQDKGQKDDMDVVFKGFRNYKNLDYIACWFWKGANYINDTKSQCAFVSTNSVCQGEQISMLWSPLLAKNVYINFAYHSFLWSNNAKNKAAVFCVIVGISSLKSTKRRIYSKSTMILANHINGYLMNADDISIGRLSQPISDFPLICKGSMARDDGNLLLDQTDKDKLVLSYPELNKFIKPFIGGAEFLHDIKRYCLWLTEEAYTEFGNIPELNERYHNVSVFRANSDAPSTREYSKRPYLFVQRTYKEEPFVYVPQVTSSRREYVPIGLFDAGTITSDKAFSVYNGGRKMFAILSSKMHVIWFKTFGGRLKNDYSYSSNMCYNSFPFPKINNIQKAELEKLAQEILNVRDEHFDLTLGEMYNPESMPEDLKEAHHQLDLAVERCYRKEPFASDEERLEHLFKLYSKMTKK
jgi:hypothetical protein